MDETVAASLADTFLERASASAGDFLSSPLSFERKTPQPLSDGLPEDHLGQSPVAIQVVAPNDVGAPALVLDVPGAVALASAALGIEANRDSLDDDDKSALGELGSALLFAGLTALFEKAQRDVDELTGLEVAVHVDEALSEVMELIGADATAVPCSFSSESGISVQAALLLGEDLAALAVGNAKDGASALLSPDEMSDILGEFDDPPESAEGNELPQGVAPPGQAPDNLDMVLDIRLEATARLGCVEMPISDILNLGPGSIIEVGHLVDEPVELLINGKLVARGDVVVVDEKFGLRITEIVSTQERINSLR